MQATADAVGQQHHQPLRSAEAGEQRTEAIDEQCGTDTIEEVDERAAEIDGEHEHQIHDRHEDGNTEPAAEYGAVDTVGQRLVELAALLDDGAGKRMGMAEAAAGDMNIGIFPGAVADDLLPPFHLVAKIVVCLLQQAVVAFEQFQGEPVFDAMLAVAVDVVDQIGNGLLDNLLVCQPVTGGAFAGHDLQ